MITDGMWDGLDAEIARQIEARLAELREQGKTLYEQAIDEDDTSTAAPELWCIRKTDTNEIVQRRMSDDDVAVFIEGHPEWIDIWSVDDEVREYVSDHWFD